MKLERELGEGIGFSIGTAIPLEANIFIEKPEAQELWMNVYTLFRNFYGSVTDPERVDRNVLIQAFLTEVLDLYNLAKQTGIVPVLYTTSQGSALARLFPKAKVKVPRTPKQVLYADIEAMAIRILLQSIIGKEIRQFSVRLQGDTRKKTYILSHFPLDLMSDYEFGYLILMESHTGELKTRADWISKLATKEDQMHLPFNLLTLQILGDKGKQFLSMEQRYKNALVALANQCRWTPVSHVRNVERDIKNSKGEFTDLFLDLLRTPIR